MSLGRFDSYTLPPRPAANAACGAAKSPYLCASRGPIIEGYAPPAALHPGQAAAAHLRLGARGGRLVHVGGLSRCERGGRGHGERPPGERHHPDRRPAANLRDPAPRQRARRGRQPGGPGVSAGPRAPDARGGPRGDAAGGPSGSADRRRRARQHRWRAPALAHRQRVPRPSPPLDLQRAAAGVVRYERPGLGEVLATARAVRGAPWAVVVEFPRKVVLAPARLFLRSQVFRIGAVLLVGLLAAWGLSGT